MHDILKTRRCKVFNIYLSINTSSTNKKKVLSSLFHQKHSIRAPETWCSKAAHSGPPWLDPSSDAQICWLLCWISDYIFNSFSSDVFMAIKVKYTYMIPHRCCFLKLRLKQARWSRSSLSRRTQVIRSQTLDLTGQSKGRLSQPFWSGACITSIPTGRRFPHSVQFWICIFQHCVV